MILPLYKSFSKKSNYGLALASELFAILLRWKTKNLPRPTEPNSWRKGLLIGANHIGDLLYRSCSLLQLQKGLPNMRWHLLAPRSAGQILEGHPTIHALHEPPSGKNCFSSSQFQELLQEKFDVAICYNTGQYVKDLLLALRLGIPNRVGYVHKGFSAWVTHPVTISYPQPFPAYFRDLVGELTGARDDSPLRPQVFPRPEDEQMAEQIWQKLDCSPNKPVVCCFLTTRQPHGVWPKENLANALRIVEGRRPEVKTLLLGAPGESVLLEAVKKTIGLRAEIVYEPMNLCALVCFLRRATAVLTTDSGPRHLANAAGSTPVFFRNLWADPVETGAYLDTEVDLAPPGIGRIPPAKQAPYFKMITPEDAARAVEKILTTNRH